MAQGEDIASENRGVGGGIIDGIEAVSEPLNATRCARPWLCVSLLLSVTLAQPAESRARTHTDTRFKRLRLQDLTSTEME